MMTAGKCDSESYEELLAKNKSLSDQLQQCLRDKDFVWNLWKELQVSHPNTTAIVNSVLQREQEKSDAKDLKVLTVLKEKDEQIRILQEISADMQIQLNSSNSRVSELLVEQSDWHKSSNDLKLEIAELKKDLDTKNELLHGKDVDISADIEKELEELKQKMEGIVTAEQSLKQNIVSLNHDLECVSKEKGLMEANIVAKDETISSLQSVLDKSNEERDALRDEIEALKKNASKLKSALKKKEKESEEIRNYWESEVSKNSATINEQGEQLEQHQQQVLYLSKQLLVHETCSQRIEEQSQLIQRLEALQDESHKVLVQQQRAHEDEVNLHKKSIKVLRKKVAQLQDAAKSDGPDENLEVDSQPGGNIQMDPKEIAVSVNHIEKSTQTHIANDLSSSEISSSDTDAQGYIEMLLELIRSLEDNMETTKAAHQRRSDRYQRLEENYHLVREQLATYEDGEKKTEKKIKRASVKSLQREESQSVWNELEYYRREYEKYASEEPVIMEELDQLKVVKTENVMVIKNLQVRLESLRRTLCEKEAQIERNEVEKNANASKIKSLKNEAICCERKKNNLEKEFIELREAYDHQIDRETLLQEELSGVLMTIDGMKKENLKPDMSDEGTQTEKCNDDQKPPLPETCCHCQEPSIVLVADDEKFQIVEFAAAACQTINRSLTESSSQTVETNLSTTELEKVRVTLQEEKSKLKDDCEHLRALYNKTKQENEKLKLKKCELEKDVAKAMESEQMLRTYISNIEKSKEKLKHEVLENLQEIKESHLLVEMKSKEVAGLSHELDVALSNEEKGNIGGKQKLKKIKSLEKELEETLSKCSQQSFEVKTLQGENEILCDQQKSYQDRVGKLEKDLIKKKTQLEETKTKLGETKSELNEKIEIIEKLNGKIRTLNDRESSRKLHIEELKAKVEALGKDKAVLQNTLSFLTVDNNNKAELLQKTQHLCHQAETAISELELTSTTEIERERKAYKDKYSKLNSLYEKSCKHVNALKAVVKAFAEGLIIKISENYKKMTELKKNRRNKLMEEKKSKFMESNTSNVAACSILGMSTQDLMDFMNEEKSEDKLTSPKIDVNDMRNKLTLILKKEFNFEEVLKQFLLDLVKLNETYLEHQLGEK